MVEDILLFLGFLPLALGIWIGKYLIPVVSVAQTLKKKIILELFKKNYAVDNLKDQMYSNKLTQSNESESDAIRIRARLAGQQMEATGKWIQELT